MSVFAADTRLSSPQLCKLAGITYRQLDYWCRRDDYLARFGGGLLGSGNHRRWSPRLALAIRIAGSVTDALGGKLQRVILFKVMTAVMNGDDYLELDHGITLAWDPVEHERMIERAWLVEL